MKKVIALATLMTSVFVQAQSSSDLSFGDLNYFFKKGEFNLSADINLERNEFSTRFGGFKTTTESEAFAMSTRGTFALADNLHAFVGMTYLHEYNFNSEPTVARDDYSQDGLANPVIGANYRLMNQRQSAYNWDVGILARLSLMDEERGSAAGSSSKNGNAATGNHSVEANTSMGRKWNEANEWRLTTGAQYNMDGENTVNGVPDVKSDTDSSFDVFLRAAYQYRPVNEFMMALTAQATKVGEREQETTNQTPRTTSTSESHINYDFTFTAKYLITENFIGRFNYGQSRLADIDVDSTVDRKINRRRGQFYGLGVDFLF